ncbi:hypothetical protein BC939DRAFT_478649 [Gamsiella multidivaricata]|uniref:uncharacterized protein n=1 Tax=Gamsiella multidivaricata TaxID=101098 RepID=UPI002220EF1B|nr:uncharacterized protein BC939DRAFT_478649 [Gamsiella multidivaricata]KAI7820770.1 hypothetical protein BC939DRAFT_478649 [Gamsiella multidivaricata]
MAHHHHNNSNHGAAGSSSSSLHRPTSSSAKTTPMHDDSDAGRLIPINQPALAIDYLGNGWQNEDDIAQSWKFMTKQKNDLINGLRLENASWRNWAKQRHNLQTISPKALNWLKDSDTTWLYGPLYKAAIDEFDMSRFGSETLTSTASPGIGTVSMPTTPTKELPNGLQSSAKKALKPVLKHKTASELFKADTLFHVQSDLKLARRILPQHKAIESAVFKEHRQPKLRFNDSVEQCVSIDTDTISEEEEEDDDDEDEDEEGEEYIQPENEDGNGDEGTTSMNRRRRQENEDEDSGIMMRISARKPVQSIVRIDPTRLKAANLHGMDPEDIISPIDGDFDGDNGDSDNSGGNDDDVDDDVDDELEEEDEEMFDEPIYLGNPYTGSETGYTGKYTTRPGSGLDYAEHADEATVAETLASFIFDCIIRPNTPSPSLNPSSSSSSSPSPSPSLSSDLSLSSISIFISSSNSSSSPIAIRIPVNINIGHFDICRTRWSSALFTC